MNIFFIVKYDTRGHPMVIHVTIEPKMVNKIKHVDQSLFDCKSFWYFLLHSHLTTPPLKNGCLIRESNQKKNVYLGYA